ncbi:hypothetical protein J4E08_15680 [Sagittula sp. NFXS13]|uniref:hypothetical protein n=1 Tax=Sagittula sp. NFXS13 TaxID=2819095 RepID=UPI0032DF2E9B
MPHMFPCLYLLPVVALTLAGCTGARTDLPLTIGPVGASGSLQSGPGRMILRLADTRCTANPRPAPSGTANAPLHIGAVTCRDGRLGSVSITRRATPAETYDGLLELDGTPTGLSTRLVFGPAINEGPT